MYRETLQQRIITLIEPLLLQQDVELVELQAQQQKGRCFIRLYVDTAEGIAIEDCQKLSYSIGQILDNEDAISASSYVLEVSSPGLDRPLRVLRDFQRQCHRLVRVFLHTPLMGKTQYMGRIASATQADLVLHIPPDTPISIPDRKSVV